ncbi:hypothetical protein IDH21_00370 [Pelagibacterales bacterium SAG-MED47]|nr:hypothetical protein [Pelagibacterales bacterium SAG-MED47]
MKILKLLNKKNLFILVILILGSIVRAEEKPLDIWSIDKKEIENNLKVNEETNNQNKNNEIQGETNIYKMQSQKEINSIELDEKLVSRKVKIYGLYDPDDYDLDINMWSNSNGDQLKKLFSKLNSIKLSKDASEIMNISLLTNSHFPEKNITEKEFLRFKSDWLIKNSDLDLIEEYLIKNQIFNLHPELTKYLVNKYLSESNIEKACNLFQKNTHSIDDEYLSKFNIYCLIYLNKKDEAQLIFDLKKELGFEDKYFEKKINFLFGYTSKINEKISEDSILDFHLAHITNPNFTFEPNESTSKIIWKYLSSTNLLSSFQQIESSELEKILLLEKATNNKDYPEKDLFEIYKRFQFSINQLLNAESSYKSLSKIEARALIYQKALLESEMIEKLKLLKILKGLFKKDNLNNAFDTELKKFLEKINPTDVPDNLTSFYYTNIKIKDETENSIKVNNDILHQSKLLNYFNGDYSKSKIEKDVNNFLKKIKKDKKYSLSKKDQIFLESLQFDGIEISKKYVDLFQPNESEIPSDMQVMVNNNEKGAILLRIIEVIGQDKIERIDDDTIYFVIRVLNQLNIDFIRNKILLKVLPLKV